MKTVVKRKECDKSDCIYIHDRQCQNSIINEHYNYPLSNCFYCRNISVTGKLTNDKRRDNILSKGKDGEIKGRQVR